MHQQRIVVKVNLTAGGSPGPPALIDLWVCPPRALTPPAPGRRLTHAIFEQARLPASPPSTAPALQRAYRTVDRRHAREHGRDISARVRKAIRLAGAAETEAEVAAGGKDSEQVAWAS